jgi:hypothetical protein
MNKQARDHRAYVERMSEMYADMPDQDWFTEALVRHAESYEWLDQKATLLPLRKQRTAARKAARVAAQAVYEAELERQMEAIG